jgi:hypothetical protein
MTFDDIMEQALDMLRRRGRVSYRSLKRQCTLDDDDLPTSKPKCSIRPDAELLTLEKAGHDLPKGYEDDSVSRMLALQTV